MTAACLSSFPRSRRPADRPLGHNLSRRAWQKTALKKEEMKEDEEEKKGECQKEREKKE